MGISLNDISAKKGKEHITTECAKHTASFQAQFFIWDKFNLPLYSSSEKKYSIVIKGW